MTMISLENRPALLFPVSLRVNWLPCRSVAIYTFGPTFRAEENSNTSRHLAEFWMIEPEVAFNEIAENMQLAEDFIKYCIQWALDNCKEDIEFLSKMYDKELIERLEFVFEE